MYPLANQSGTKSKSWDFPGGPVAKILPTSARGIGLIPAWGVEIPHASWPEKQQQQQKTIKPIL